MKNLMTDAMEKVFGMMSRVDKTFQKMGETPYGMEKATTAEKRQMFTQLKSIVENRSTEDWAAFVAEVGPEKAQQWFQDYMKEEEKYGRSV